jgi:hypothetical protein
MNHDVDVLTMVRRANPLPDLDRFDPNEVAAGVAAIEAAWQTDKQAPVARPLPVPSSRQQDGGTQFGARQQEGCYGGAEYWH